MAGGAGAKKITVGCVRVYLNACVCVCVFVVRMREERTGRRAEGDGGDKGGGRPETTVRDSQAGTKTDVAVIHFFPSHIIVVFGVCGFVCVCADALISFLHHLSISSS